MTRADVTIYGAGVFGLSIAWACLQKGARVQVIDPHGPGAGASGGLVGALAPHVPENWNDKKAFQLDSLLMAERFWQEVDGVSGLSSGYGRLGRLQPIADERTLELAHARTETAKTLWHGEARWEVIAQPQTAWAPVSPTGYLIHDTLSARIHPRRACGSLATALQKNGASVLTEGEAQGAIVHADGAAGLEKLSQQLDHTVGNGVKGQAALLDFSAPNAAQLFADGLHIVPHADGTTAIGSTSERDYDDPTATDEQLDAVIDKAMRALPVLQGTRVIERWAGLRPRARSRAPMLGPHPLRQGEFIANGGFKIGFGMAPKVAEVMARIVLDGDDTIPADFRVEASLPKGMA
jgi:glycine oxidase